jgi:hypothetical protein
MSEPKNWIVIQGQIVDTVDGGGFEFFGPFTEKEARNVRSRMKAFTQEHGGTEISTIALQLLNVPDDRTVDRRTGNER